MFKYFDDEFATKFLEDRIAFRTDTYWEFNIIEEFRRGIRAMLYYPCCNMNKNITVNSYSVYGQDGTNFSAICVINAYGTTDTLNIIFDNSTGSDTRKAHMRMVKDTCKCKEELSDTTKYVCNAIGRTEEEVAIFRDSEKNYCTIIMPGVNNFNIRKGVLSIIPKLMCTMFQDDFVGKKEIIDLAVAYGTASNESEIESYISKIVRITDLDTKAENAMIQNLIAAAYRNVSTQIEYRLSDLNKIIDNILGEITERIGERDTYNAKLIVAKKNSDKQNEIIEYLKTNPNIKLFYNDCGDAVISFACYNDLVNFEEDRYNSVRDNIVDSYELRNFSTYVKTTYTDEDLLLVLDAIFKEDSRYVVKTFGMFEYDAAKNTIRARSSSYSNGYGYAPINAKRIPNPHLFHYGCLGNNEQHIAKALIDNDIIYAFECCISATASINCLEYGPTFSLFINSFFDTYCMTDCIYDTVDNVYFSPASLLKHLKESANKDNEENKE